MQKLDDWCSYENDYMGNPSTQDCERNRACKVDEYLDIKNSSCGKLLVDKWVLECKDEIINTVETLIDNNLALCENNCLIHTILLLIIDTSLLAAVSIGCY